MTTSTPLPEQGGDVPTGLDEAVRMFAGYVRGENGFDELDFKEWLIEWHNKQTSEAIHGFHGFVMEADIIRPEADQSFNYGRLHRAVDDYIAERNKQ